MPVPSSISDLSTTPALNSPPGSESPSSIDDYLRTLSAFIRQINDLAATKADDSAVVKLTGAQTVAGTKTFSASPVVPDATAPKHPVTKDQLDAKAPIASPAFTGVPTAPNPTAGTRSQALSTMQMFADEFGSSLAGNGYQKLPSGLIVQWGEFTFTGTQGTNYSTTFPVTFPSSCAQLTTVNNNAAGTAVTVIHTPYVSKTTSGFTVQYGAVNGASYSTTVRYVAIGY